MSIMDKVLKLLGMQEEDHQEEIDLVDEFSLKEISSTEIIQSEVNNSKTMRMVVLNCRYVKDATQVVNNLKVNRPVIVTLSDADPDESQRIIDFISGAIYAMEGELEKISVDTFVFAPKNFIVDKEKCEELVKEEATLFHNNSLDK